MGVSQLRPSAQACLDVSFEEKELSLLERSDAVMRAERQARMRRTPGILDTGTPVGMAIG